MNIRNIVAVGGLAVALALGGVLAACGGSGGSSNPGPGTPHPGTPQEQVTPTVTEITETDFTDESGNVTRIFHNHYSDGSTTTCTFFPPPVTAPDLPPQAVGDCVPGDR